MGASTENSVRSTKEVFYCSEMAPERTPILQLHHLQHASQLVLASIVSVEKFLPSSHVTSYRIGWPRSKRIPISTRKATIKTIIKALGILASDFPAYMGRLPK